MSYCRYSILILTFALAGLAATRPQAASLDGPPSRQAALPGNLKRQIDHLVNLLRDGRGQEDRGARTVRLTRLRDGTPLALVVCYLHHYRGANNRGEFLAAFAGDDALGKPASSVHYRLLGVTKTSESDTRRATDLVLAGEEAGQLVIRLSTAEGLAGTGEPPCQRAAEYRIKRELLYWSGEGAVTILPGPAPCGD